MYSGMCVHNHYHVYKSDATVCSFDLIYDAVGNKDIADNAASLLRPFTGATYVSIVIPFLSNVDANGVVFGLTKSACQLSTSVAKVIC